MKNIVRVFFLCIAIAFGACKEPASKGSEQVVLFKMGEEPVYVDEFKYVYEKHNSNSEDFYSHKSVHEYLDLYANFRLKIKEAEALKMDTNAAFITELAGHKKSLAGPYLTEKSVSESLITEAYDRMKEEVRASHILIRVEADAEPKDTLAAYNKIKEVKSKATAKTDFAELAKQYSEDPSAKENGGDLGYFSSFAMVYPFEDKAFNTPIGEVSDIFKTQFGYHILKVTDRRPSKGKVKVAHIMIRASQGMDTEDSVTAKNKIDEISKRLKEGEDWSAMVKQFSEDGNSKAKDGELQFIDVNSRIVESFKEAAFGLQNPGSISEPVQTPYGWHIIKLIEKEPLAPFEEMEKDLTSRVSRDSRSELGQQALLKRLKKENRFVENQASLDIAVAKADSSLLTKTFVIPTKDKDFDAVLFTIMDEKYTIRNLYEFMNESGKKRNVSPEYFVRLTYTDFVDHKLLDYETRHLEDKYVDFRMLYKEYRDGILMFNLMDEKVWSVSTTDTIGLQTFFKKNNANYQWGKRADAVIYDCENKLIAEKVKSELVYGKYPVSNPDDIQTYYETGSSKLSDQDLKKILASARRINNDSTLFINLTGISSKAEEKKTKGLAEKRALEVKNYLVENSIPEKNIFTITAAFRNDAKAEEKIKHMLDVQFLSSSDRALENYINKISPLALKVFRGKFEKGEQVALSKIDWKVGEYTFTEGDRTYYIIINDVLEPRAKDLNEVKGEAISDYQTYLENQWIASLKNKYPIEYNEGEIKKLIKE